MNELDSLSAVKQLTQIAQQTTHVVENTRSNFLHDDMSLIAILSLIATVFGLLSIWIDARRNKIDSDCQLSIIKDIIRHFYRNKICTLAMWLKYREMYKTKNDEGAKLFYPSDEHYLKLKVLPDDLHLEKFYRKQDSFDALHNLHLLMRNYNTEIETSLQHIQNEKLPIVTKIRDFKTLNLKCGLITGKIIEHIGFIRKNLNGVEMAWEIIKKDQERNRKDNQFDINNVDAETINLVDTLLNEIKESDLYLDRVVADKNSDVFWQDMRIDLLIEVSCTNKIHIIEFDDEIL